MTAQHTTGPQWRVRLQNTAGQQRLSSLMTEQEAIAVAVDIATLASAAQNRMLAFPSRHGVTAWIRAADVHSVEPAGPRWDGVYDGPRSGDEQGSEQDDEQGDEQGDVQDDEQGDVPGPDPAPVSELAELVADGATVASDGTAWLRTRERQQASRKRKQR